MSRRAEGSEQVSRPAEGWVEPGVIRQAGNAATGIAAPPGLLNTEVGGGPRPWSDFRPALLLGYCCHRTLRRSGR